MPIAPADATIQITGNTGTITGNMASRPIPIGLILYPGSNGGPGPNGREVVGYVANGTTGATVTFKSAFPSDFAAGTFFYVPDGPPIGTTGYAVSLNQRMTDRLEELFGPDFLGVSQTSRQVTLARSDEPNSFARIAYKVGNALAYLMGSRTVGGRKVWTLQALPDGSQIVDALEVDQATGGVTYRVAEELIASAATCDLGSVRSFCLAISGTTTITSFGSVPRQLKLLRFGAALTLTHSASLILPGGANIVTATDDTAIARSDASGNWRIYAYQRAVTPSSQNLSPGASPTFGVVAMTANTETNYAPTAQFVSASGAFAIFGRVGANAAGTVVFLDAFVPGVGGTKRPIALSPYGLGGVTIGSTAAPAGALDVYGGPILPGIDNAVAMGSASKRFTTYYGVTGSINTSDAREKTSVVAMTAAEIAAARDIAAEIGTFQWLASIAEKGETQARRHVGITVQRAIEIMQGHGLDPFRYAFICHDTYEAEPGRHAEDAQDEVLDEAGNLIEPARPAIEAIPPRAAGDVYSLRPDQLALFVARGQEARLAAIEAALAA